MYKKKIDEDIRCPLEYGLSILGGKWNNRIICVLDALGDLRFSQIQAEMVNISDGVLGNTLKTLITEGLIEKKTLPAKEDKVKKMDSKVYGLTEKGRSSVPIYKEICRWSGQFFHDKGSIVMAHCQKCEFYPNWGSEPEANLQEGSVHA